MRKPWTDTEVQLLKIIYPDNQCACIAEILMRSMRSIYSEARLLGLSKSDEFKKSELSGRITKMLIRGEIYRFRKGHKPFNKGLSMDAFMSPETKRKFLRNTFRKGHLPHNTKADGEISVRRDKLGHNYKFIRLSLGIWQSLHVHNWKKAYGEVPAGFIVVFKTSDRMNCDVSNLELITRAENMMRNTIQRYPADLQLAMKALKQLNHRINGKEQNTGSERSFI